MPYDPRIISGIMSTASALQMDPVDLATIMSYETAGTFDPTKRGPTTKWGQHEGLIQFGQPQQQQYGYDRSRPIESQLGPDGAVAKYFRQNGWKPGMGRLDAYSIVNAGGPGRYNASDTAAGGAPGTVRDKVMQQFGPHQAKAMALLGLDTTGMTGQPMFPGDPTMSSRSAPPDIAMATGMMGAPMLDANLPNGPVPQYTPRQGMIAQLRGGNLRGALGGMFNPQDGVNPRLEAERFGRMGENLGGISDSIMASQNANAPTSWMAVLGSLGAEAGEQFYNSREEKATGIAGQQMQEALGQQMTPERIAQIAALDPELGQALMGQQRQFDQTWALSQEKFRQDQVLNEQAAALEGPDSIDPTALMQNLVAAGYTPGTPEYEAAMQQLLVSETQKSGMGVTGYDADGRPIIGMTTTGAAPLPAPGGGVAGAAPAVPPVVAGAVPGGAPGAPLPQAITDAITGIPGTGGSSTSVVPSGGPVEIDKTQGTVTAPGPTGALEQTPIEGGKVDRETTEAAAAEARRAADSRQEAGTAITTLDDIDKLAENWFTTGAPGAITGKIPGTPGYDMRAKVTTLASIIGFDELMQMRLNSPTGASLGNVTEREIEFLQSIAGNLDPNQGEAQFKKNMADVRKRFEAVANGDMSVYTDDELRAINEERVQKGMQPYERKAATPAASQYETGKIYTDAQGNRARWNGTGWEELN